MVFGRQPQSKVALNLNYQGDIYIRSAAIALHILIVVVPVVFYLQLACVRMVGK